MRTSAYSASVISSIKMAYVEAALDTTAIMCIAAIAEYAAEVLFSTAVCGCIVGNIAHGITVNYMADGGILRTNDTAGRKV